MPIATRSLNFIRSLTEKGGPETSDYSQLDFIFCELHQMVVDDKFTAGDSEILRETLGAALSLSTMQGFALARPHGYAGDFEVIDRIYQHTTSSDSRLAKWDAYYHQHAAPKAVRNRKTYFHRILDDHCCRKQKVDVLKIAIGPGRSMFEWLQRNPTYPVTFDCVELDPKAIEYASRLNEPFLDRVTMTQMNALRFRPQKKYDLIWIAGLFDYFEDKVFVRLLSRYLKALNSEGELVLGNFSTHNPSRPYMELVGGWNLCHRDSAKLYALTELAGASPSQMDIGAEPENVNLFLHIVENSKLQTSAWRATTETT